MSSDSGFSEVELRKFSESGRTIAAAMQTSVELWARAEAGVILKTWAGRTKVGTVEKATIRATLQAYRISRRTAGYSSPKGRTGPGEASINLGLRAGDKGKVYYRTRKRGTLGGRSGFQDAFGPGFSHGKHIAPRDWGSVRYMVDSFRHQVDQLVPAAKRALGLARQSIVQIADDLGIRLETVKGGGTLSASGIAKARAALASNGQAYTNGYGTVTKNAREFYVTLVNRYPRLGPLFMDTTLQGVIMGRLKYFRKNLEEGTFLSAQRAAKAYPYLEVLRISS